jgi:hypothetical protein
MVSESHGYSISVTVMVSESDGYSIDGPRHEADRHHMRGVGPFPEILIQQISDISDSRHMREDTRQAGGRSGRQRGH